MSTNQVEVKRGRGRPQSETARKLVQRFQADGRVGVRFGESVGVSEGTARMRLYNMGRRLGVPVRVTIQGTGAVRRLVAEPRPEPAAEESTESTEAN